MSYYLGVDIGSETSKAVVVHEGVEIAFHSLRSGINYRLAANKVYEEILTVAKLSTNDIVNIVATGQGASMVEYAKRQVADMRCCAKGMLSVFPLVRTLIDVEAQSTQVMRLDSEGQIINFMTSERCAAGAGRFVDIIANVLQIPLYEIGQGSLKSKKPITFTTACAVFGESEAVSRVAEGVSIEDILAGVHKALAEKIGSMVERAGPVAPYGICGGGALNIGLVEWVARTLKVELLIPPHPQFITAYGAAIFASEPSKIDKFIM